MPQLFEAGFEELFDKIILISAKEDIRLKRLMERNLLNIDDAKMRINSQMPEIEKIKKCDIIIENNFTEESFKKNLLEQVIIPLKELKNRYYF